MISISLDMPFQTTFSIHTDNEAVLSALNLKYGRYFSIVEKQSDVTIVVNKTSDGYVVISLGNTFVMQDPIYKIDRIIYQNTKYNEKIFALHGAAVEWNGKAYVFLAATSSGKTTLTSYLCANGFGYITDDCVLLERENFRIHPFSAPVHLRKGGFEVLVKYHAEPKKYEILHEEPADRYVYTPENCVLSDLPLSRIFFIERTENENKLAEMNTTERMIELMKSPITVYKTTPDYLKFISRLANANCNKLLYSDMAYVAEVIKNGG